MKKRIFSCILCMSFLCFLFMTGNLADSPEGNGMGEVSMVHSQEESNKEAENMQNNTMTPQVQPELTIADISSKELVSGMRIGWNLGNTLDATGGMGIDSERSWGNPTTTKEMIDAVVDAGFNVIRIPVTWDGHFTDAPEYKIHDAWLERVKEVVDYAYERDVYVILNMHHEEWHFPSEENKEQASEILKALWTQIANYFMEYDEHLIFEGLNEPRKVGTEVEWNAGDAEGREVVNHFAEVFVETVRATGGNNTYRHLMVTGYAASCNRGSMEGIRVPKDDRLIVSIHAYTPYDFALNISGTDKWDAEKDAGDINYVFESIEELFLQKGIPVIIGEFGAMNRDNEPERVEWVTYYLSKSKEYGVPCVWWDNHSFTGSGEKFGLFNRYDLNFPYADLLDAMMKTTEK